MNFTNDLVSGKQSSAYGPTATSCGSPTTTSIPATSNDAAGTDTTTATTKWRNGAEQRKPINDRSSIPSKQSRHAWCHITTSHGRSTTTSTATSSTAAGSQCEITGAAAAATASASSTTAATRHSTTTAATTKPASSAQSTATAGVGTGSADSNAASSE